MSESQEEQLLQPYSVDQLAGAVVLCLGAIGSLLLVIWQSRCLCKINLCYIFQCERRPPSEEEMQGLKNKAASLKKKDKVDKVDRNSKELDPKSPKSPGSAIGEPEPEPEPILPPQNP
tara:strand:+ start:133 stop:486 length:354 start_codon:yes stop_codon:yes gene_type:complete